MVLLCITIKKNQQKMTMNTNPGGSLSSFALDEKNQETMTSRQAHLFLHLMKKIKRR
jgi:hypothetical protein